jgi:hypothetical protein
MKPEIIELENLSKIFEYEKISRELDSCNEINDIRNVAKCYVKLYLKQQETLTNLSLEYIKD